MAHPHRILYAAPDWITGGKIVFTAASGHYARNVLRLKPGDEVHATDGLGTLYSGVIISVRRSSVTAEISARRSMANPSSISIDVAFAPLKGNRGDLIVEKGTELGVRRFLLFPSCHSVARHKGAAGTGHLVGVAIAAMLQSRRFYLPVVETFTDATKLADEFGRYDCVLAGDPSGQNDVPAGKTSFLWIVGPEGGMAGPEIEAFKQRGAALLSLGQNRLRSETAALAGLVKILASYRQL